MLKKIVLVLLLMFSLVYSKKEDYIVLIHGFLRSSSCMEKAEEYFQKKGYRTVNIDYPSTEYDIPGICSLYVKPELKDLVKDTSSKMHFFTHSMGGIIARYYIENNSLQNLGKVVMLSPPNRGSQLAETLKDWNLFTTLLGPALKSMGRDSSDLVNQLKNPEYPLAVIVGEDSFNPITSAIIEGNDDGIISVETTRIEGIDEFKVVDNTHTFIVYDKKILNMSHNFIRYSSFTNR